jgi:shikimate dehydrogenase
MLNASTKVFGVVGNPLTQSRGIFVHNALYGAAGVNAVYCRFPVADLPSFMSHVAPSLSGFSVTIPWKEEMMHHVKGVDDLGRGIGAVNTVVRTRRGLEGTNTDATGALDALEHVTAVRGRKILVLGAGGAARAIIYEARRRGANVVCTNRTPLKGKQLAEEFGVSYVPFETAVSVDADIVVNATSVGMAPHIDVTPFPRAMLRGKVVFDAVYNPPMTRLLTEAREEGATVISGVDMYVNQGIRQVELFTGLRPRPSRMRNLLLRSMLP